MAFSDEDPPDRWNLKLSPFKILGVSSTNPKPDEVKKAYKSKIKKLHPDTIKGKEREAVELTAAYNFLKNKNASQLQELASEFNGSLSGQLPKEDNRDLSNVLVDKTTSERYRRLFETKVLFAQSAKFKDNFQEVYKKVFDKVSTHPPKDSGYDCALCEEAFIQIDHHDNLVYQPYQDFVLNGAETGLWEYLENLFGKEVVHWNPPDDGLKSGEWTEKNASKHFTDWCCWLPTYKQQWEKFGKISRLNQNHKNALPLLSALFSARNASVDEIWETIINSLPQCTDPGKISCAEFLLPAFLHTYKSVQNWYKLTLNISHKAPRLAIIFELTKKVANHPTEDTFYQLGESIIKSGNDIRYAHLCFLLGSCDLNFLGRQIVAISNHIDCHNLSAYYLCRSNDVKHLESLGNDALAKKNLDVAAVYFLALFRYYFLQKEDIDNAIRSMSPLLTGNKYWKFVQNFALEFPHYAFTYNSLVVAEVTIDKILKELDSQEELTVDQVLNEVLLVDKNSAASLPAISGALHVLHEDKELYLVAITKVHAVIKRQLDNWLKEGKTQFIFGLARIPGIGIWLKDTLIFKQFLGNHAVKRQPGSMYDACLLVLRGVYYYRTKKFASMILDMFTASMYSPTLKVTTAIAKFLTENPMIHETVLKKSSKQFMQLKAYIEDYTGEPLTEQNFAQILQPTICNEKADLSDNFSSSFDGIDLQALEKDILGREQEDKEGIFEPGASAQQIESDQLAEKGYQYVDLEVICSGVMETICCMVMAANYFFKAMKATPNENVAQKYGYHALILECCKEIRPYARAAQYLHAQPSLYALRCYQSFVFQANQHFSEILRKNKKHNGTTPFIDEGGVMQFQYNYWQSVLNQISVNPVLIPEIYTITEGSLVLTFMQHLHNEFIKGKVGSGLYSRNVPEYAFHLELFNHVWMGRISPENTGYEDKIPDLTLITKLLNELERCEVATPAEQVLKQLRKEQLKNRKREIEEVKQMLENIPLVQRIGFQATRENAMASLAQFYGYNLQDVEAMMSWHVIRRDSDGFMDMRNNRTLKFDGEQAYSKFCGVKFDGASKKFEFLLEPAVPGDPHRPALFSGTDLLEIFGGKIIAAQLSFEEQIITEDVPEYMQMILPCHPFFRVMFVGATPDGNSSKESICGTNFLMTLYHLDLLAKILTTGQEVGAKYPFPFRDTTSHLLKGLSRSLQEVLKPIGPRKKVRNLRSLEVIHRFWFTVDEVETSMDVNATKFSVKFGDATVTLNTRAMSRSEDGTLNDDDDIDRESAEFKFAKGFNENIKLIEREFPIIQRMKELAKISQCFWILQQQKELFSQLSPDFKNFINLKLPTVRPYSNCGGLKRKCNCCNWVPAVYHQMKVTLEQKWEYVYEKYRDIQVPDNAVERNKDAMRQLCGSKSSEEQKEPKASPSGSQNPESQKDEKKPKVDIGKYDGIEIYRCYGGVKFFPNSNLVNNIIGSPGQRAFAWTNVIQGGYGSRLPARVPLGANERFLVQNMQASSGRSSGSGGPPSSTSSSSPGSPAGGSGNNGNGGRRPPPPPPPVQMPKNDGQLKHIFRNAPNHLRDTPENRAMLTNLANNPKTFLGTDKFGNKWNAETLPDGKQAWVSHRNGVVMNGGKNDTPRSFHPDSGLSSPVKPKNKE